MIVQLSFCLGKAEININFLTKILVPFAILKEEKKNIQLKL